MKAIIFAAGLGTRFKPWTDKHPKALAVINGKNLLQRNIEYLQQYGINDVVVNVHHFPDQVIDSIIKNNGWGSNIAISNESDELLETGGGLLKAKNLLQDGKPFISINADILTDLDINKLIAFHEVHQSLISLAVTNRKTSRYLLFDNSNRLCGWKNITTGEEKIPVNKPDLVQKAFSGIAVFSPEIFSLIPFTGKFSLIDVYLSLAPENLIMGYDHSGGRLVDVGKPESITLANSLFP